MSTHVLDPLDTSNSCPCLLVPPRLPNRVRRFGFVPNYSDLRVGDLILVSPIEPTISQRLIRRGQEFDCFGPEDAKWTHAAVYIGEFNVCEATALGVRVASIFDYVPASRLRFRRPLFPGEERWSLAIRALTRLRRPYDLAAILRIVGLLWYGAYRSNGRRRRSSEKAAICSQLYADAFAEASGRLIAQVPGNVVMPGDLSATQALDDVPVRWANLAE